MTITNNSGVHSKDYAINTHTHTHPFNGPLSGTTKVSSTRKVKPIWILLKQETVSGSGIRWAICKSAPRSRQITTKAPHCSVFLQAGCPSCRPTNSVKALKVTMKALCYKHMRINTLLLTVKIWNYEKCQNVTYIKAYYCCQAKKSHRSAALSVLAETRKIQR